MIEVVIFYQNTYKSEKLGNSGHYYCWTK